MPDPVLSASQLRQLGNVGYVSLDIAQFEDLYRAYAKLFDISKDYFALDDRHDDKFRYRAASGPGASEEGFSIIPTEKEIFTCRGYTRTPHVMRDAARDVWNLTGGTLRDVMSQVALDLHLQKDVFEPLLSECLEFQETRTPTLLRLFRYDRPSRDTTAQRLDPSKIVAERHKDLGLLSVVVGSTPGLEVFNEQTNEWMAIEEEAQMGGTKLCITLLAGQTLRYLTRGQYRAGIHRVRCAPRSQSDGTVDPFRYSVVFALRPYPSIIRLHDFEGRKTGTFTAEEGAGIDGESAQVLFNRLCKAHWNVNISQDIRRQQQEATNAPDFQSQNRVPLPPSLVHDLKIKSTRHPWWQKRWAKMKGRLLPTAMQTGRVV